MKKLLLLLISLILPLGIQAENMPNEVVFYDTTSGKPFTYSKTMEGSGYIDFNCPFVDNVVINGMHIEFTISNENFKWYVMRHSSKNYCDFTINVYHGGGLHDNLNNYWPQDDVYTLRIEFNR